MAEKLEHDLQVLPAFMPLSEARVLAYQRKYPGSTRQYQRSATSQNIVPGYCEVVEVSMFRYQIATVDKQGQIFPLHLFPAVHF
eukprot:545912-Rhodomonas_salina.1